MKKRLFFLPALGITFALLLVGTFLDLQVSQAVVVQGNYFTKIFAALSCVPAALTLGIASGLFTKLAREYYKKTYQKVLLIIFAVIFFVGSIYLAGDHIKSYHAFNLHGFYWYALGILVAVPGLLIGLFLFKHFESKTLLKNIIFVIAVAAFTCASIEVIKLLAPRVRYTTVMNLGVEYYRPWWKSNLTAEQLKAVKDFAALKGWGEEHKSFPSGHSNISLVSALILMYLPLMLKEKNLVKYQPLFFYGGFIYFLICASSRIVGGAHYLSDTMFAGTFALVVYLIANEIYIRKLDKEDK